MQILTDEHLNTFLEWLLPHRLTPKRNKIFRQICGNITSQQFCHAQRSSPLRKKKRQKEKKHAATCMIRANEVNTQRLIGQANAETVCRLHELRSVKRIREMITNERNSRLIIDFNLNLHAISTSQVFNIF